VASPLEGVDMPAGSGRSKLARVIVDTHVLLLRFSGVDVLVPRAPLQLDLVSSSMTPESG
jgi:hypothetical protein